MIHDEPLSVVGGSRDTVHLLVGEMERFYKQIPKGECEFQDKRFREYEELFDGNDHKREIAMETCYQEVNQVVVVGDSPSMWNILQNKIRQI